MPQQDPVEVESHEQGVDRQFSIKLSARQHMQLESLAAEMGLSKSDAMRYAIKVMNVALQHRNSLDDTVKIGDKSILILP